VRWNSPSPTRRAEYWTTMFAADRSQSRAGRRLGRLRQSHRLSQIVDPETGATQCAGTDSRRAARERKPPGHDVDDRHLTTPTQTRLLGHRQPDSGAERRGSPGNNEDTCSIVALDPNSGKKKWAFQPSPHDTHDWDAVEIPVLVDADFAASLVRC